MAEHPALGERILLRTPQLEHLAPIVRHEHERWDGGGYPDGLAGEAIPRAARVVCCCDAFHAMTTDRSYRRAMSQDSAIVELRLNSGTQFDPEVVDALIRLLDHESPARAAAAAAGPVAVPQA